MDHGAGQNLKKKIKKFLHDPLLYVAYLHKRGVDVFDFAGIRLKALL